MPGSTSTRGRSACRRSPGELPGRRAGYGIRCGCRSAGDRAPAPTLRPRNLGAVFRWCRSPAARRSTLQSRPRCARRGPQRPRRPSDRVLLGGQQLAAADRAVVDPADLADFRQPGEGLPARPPGHDLPYVPDSRARGSRSNSTAWSYGGRRPDPDRRLDGREPHDGHRRRTWRGELPQATLGQRVPKACSPLRSRWPTASGRSRAPRRVRGSIRAHRHRHRPSEGAASPARSATSSAGTRWRSATPHCGQAPDPVVGSVPRTVGGWPRPGDQSRHRAAVNGHRRPARAQCRFEVL